jgi:dipeptidyl aminopeptidase/acylaminoacyl peptidase
MKSPHLLLPLLLAGLVMTAPAGSSPQEQAEEGTLAPLVARRSEDYAKARKAFHTQLLAHSHAPQKWEPLTPPPNIQVVPYSSGRLKLSAWLQSPEGKGKHPAVLFLHGGFAFGLDDWKMTEPFRAAGFVTMLPLLRGENGQPGDFTLFYDEVDDVLAARNALAKLPNVDPKQIFIAGHSVGGTMTLLAAMTSRDFKAAASFSGSPDQALFCKYGFNSKLPFDIAKPAELEMRSPLSFAASLKCPSRLYFGTREPHFKLSSQQTAKLAKAAGHDVEAIQVPGGHDDAVPEETRRAIEFFKSVR